MKKSDDFSDSYSLRQRNIFVTGVIDDEKAQIVIAQIHYLAAQSREDIIIQINSPGGSVTAGLAIYDTMNFVDADIVTVGIGMCASMGAFLLSAGTKGKRKATKNCEILIHQPLGGVQGQASDVIIAAEHIKRTRDTLNFILAENTGKDIAVIARDTDRDYIMTADEACAYGLVDEVIPHRNKAKEDKKDV